MVEHRKEEKKSKMEQMATVTEQNHDVSLMLTDESDNLLEGRESMTSVRLPKEGD